MKANSGSDSSGHDSKSGALQRKVADEMFINGNQHVIIADNARRGYNQNDNPLPPRQNGRYRRSGTTIPSRRHALSLTDPASRPGRGRILKGLSILDNGHSWTLLVWRPSSPLRVAYLPSSRTFTLKPAGRRRKK
jgi:hypothetical protein